MDKISDCLLVHLTTYLDYKEIMRFKQVNKGTNTAIIMCNNYVWKSIINNIKNLNFIQRNGYNTLNYPGYAITYPESINVNVKEMFINLRLKLKLKDIII